jgi:hypothetical protein
MALNTLNQAASLDCKADIMGFKGLSGRTLRRLPLLSLAMHTFNDVCTIDEALTALSLAVSEERHVVAKKQREQ